MPVGWIPRISEKLGNKKGICRDKHPSGRHKQRFLLHWTLHPFTDTIAEENCGAAGENPERRSESDQVAWLNCSAEGKGGWDQDWSYDSSLQGDSEISAAGYLFRRRWIKSIRYGLEIVVLVLREREWLEGHLEPFQSNSSLYIYVASYSQVSIYHIWMSRRERENWACLNLGRKVIG